MSSEVNDKLSQEIRNLDINEICKFILLIQQLNEDDIIEVGPLEIRKVSDFIFKVNNVSVKELLDGGN